MFPFTFGFVLARSTDVVQPDIVCFSALLSSCETLGISWHSNNMTKHSPTSNVTALKMCDQVIWSDLNQQKNMRHRNPSSPQGQDYKNIKNIFSISPYSIDIRRRTLTYMWKVLKSPKLFGLLTGQTLEHSGESSWCTITQGRDTQCVLLWSWSRRCVFSTASWTSSAVTFLSNASAGDTCWYYPLLQGSFRFVKTLRPKCCCFFLACMGCTPKLEICCLTLRLWEFDGWEQEIRILEDTLGSLGQPLSQNSITLFNGWTNWISQEALKKIEEMCHEKAAISACEKSADWPWALEILEQRPSSTSCGTQEDTLGKNRKDMKMIWARG
jgi:hypothetical protein